MDRLERGNLYEITFIQQSGNMRWYQWKLTGQYCGFARHVDYTEAFFSLRPRAGNTSLRAENIMDVRHVRALKQLEDPTAADVKLPNRLPGAVPGPSRLSRRVIEMLP